jgi:hypothetical protein
MGKRTKDGNAISLEDRYRAKEKGQKRDTVFAKVDGVECDKGASIYLATPSGTIAGADQHPVLPRTRGYLLLTFTIPPSISGIAPCLILSLFFHASAFFVIINISSRWAARPSVERPLTKSLTFSAKYST